MLAPRQAALLRIYTQEGARAEGRPLHEDVLRKARAAGLAGATVLRGPMGFGASQRMRSAKILDLAANLPLVIELVDDEADLRAFVASLGPLSDVGLVTLERIEVLHYGASAATPREDA